MSKDLADWEEKEGFLYHRKCLYIPNDTQLRQEVVRLHHDLPTAGHRGQRTVCHHNSGRTRILVARNDPIYSQLRQGVHNVSSHKEPNTPGPHSNHTYSCRIHFTISRSHYGLHHGTARI